MTVLAGGVGAARFLRGLISRLDPRDLTVIVNTADDDDFYGLHVSPDIDTILYSLAGRSGPHGWGRDSESFRCLAELERLYGKAWFQLGDLDLATHVFRTDRLRQGWTLSKVTKALAAAHGLECEVLPMSDKAVRTFISLGSGKTIAFQDYLVRRRAAGSVKAIDIRGARRAAAAPGVLAAIRDASVIVLPPSNPFVSIGPILAIPGVRSALRRQRERTVAITPIIGRKPVKGPLDRMLKGLGHEVSAVGVANLYRDVASTFLLDRQDARLADRIARLGIRPVLTDTLLSPVERAEAVASVALAAVTDAKFSD